MKNITLALFTAILLSACGKGEKTTDSIIADGNLSEMRAKKAELSQKIDNLNSELALLDVQINKLDTTEQGNSILVEVDTIRPQRFQNYVATQGSINSEENIMVSPKIPGVITKVLVNEGDRVRQGQLMATMDASALQSQLQQVNSSYILAETTYERTARLWEQKIGSEMQLLQAEANKKSLMAQMDAIKAQIANSKIVAPVSGMVDKVNLKLGEMASPGINGIRVVNMGELKVEATLADRFAAFVKVGDEVKIFLPDLNDTIVEKISFVSQAIDPQSRTIAIEVRLPGKTQRLKPNMTAKLEINNYTAEKAIVVPSNVLLKNSDETGKYYLMGVEKAEKGYEVIRYDVEIGLQYGGKTEIISGLPADATIITLGFANLAEGQQVKF